MRERPAPRRTVALAGMLVVALLLGACASKDEAAEGTPAVAVPEFIGLGPWLNSEPLTIRELTAGGHVVLVDFWTYTCVNCIRTLPFLRDWDEKYRDRGLTIVGVHSPEFEFEKAPENVARAVEEYALAYPVAQDDDMLTWDAFENRYWPAKYLVGADGRIAYQHFGEGDYDETEEAIRDALEAAGHDVGDIPVGGVEAPTLDLRTAHGESVEGITRELYFGYERSYVPGAVYAAQEQYYLEPDATGFYTDPGADTYGHNQWYAHGLWTNTAEAMVHARDTEAPEDYIAFRFQARTVNPVLHPAPDGSTYDVVVTLDGAPLAADEAGPDVTFDADGRSIVHVDTPRMYAAVALPAVDDRVVALASTAQGFTIYAVTFGAYTEGP